MNSLARIIPAKASFDYIIPIILTPTIDNLLCKMFGTKSRWFQLHSVINAIIVYIIWDDIINIYSNPLMYIKEVESKMDSYFIMVIHIYHMCQLHQQQMLLTLQKYLIQYLLFHIIFQP